MKNIYILSTMAFILLVSCGGRTNDEGEETTEAPKSMLAEETQADPMENKGIGPISSLILGEIDTDMASKGQVIYDQMCTACHKAEKNFIGPAPKGILARRSPEWVMNMILNPEEMISKDPIAKALLIEYNGAPMANQNLTKEQARQVLEYFRTL